MEIKDTFKTITVPSKEVLYKEKNSKFFGYAFPINAENEIKSLIEFLRKKHFNAAHFCYAFQIGTEKVTYRTNDDGEPNNTAGMPIFGQIQSFEITNVLIVVVRYFGGVKLGVGGLIGAYKTAAQMAIEATMIIEKTINIHFTLLFEYKNLNKIMRIIKEKKLELVNQQLDLNCSIEIATRKRNAEIIYTLFNNLFEIEIKRKD